MLNINNNNNTIRNIFINKKNKLNIKRYIQKMMNLEKQMYDFFDRK
jgi:hypothetical protein